MHIVKGEVVVRVELIGHYSNIQSQVYISYMYLKVIYS